MAAFLPVSCASGLRLSLPDAELAVLRSRAKLDAAHAASVVLERTTVMEIPARKLSPSRKMFAAGGRPLAPPHEVFLEDMLDVLLCSQGAA